MKNKMIKISSRLFYTLIFLFVLLNSKAQTAIIDVNNVHQYIDGFGASSAWNGRLSNAEENAAFNNTTNNQLGLSVLRVRIAPDSLWSDELLNAQKAKQRGATIFATPWTPPAWMKTNNNVVGGELKPENYTNYVNYLNTFCNYMLDANGKKMVEVISLQNEPDITVGYESCSWNATQFQTFAKYNASGIQIPVMMAESFNSNFNLTDPTLNDPIAAANISFIGEHLYGTSVKNYQNAIDKGKRVWMTEHYYNGEDISTCMTMAKEIVDCMSDNFSAYIWWYLCAPGCNLVNSDATIQKKGYIMAQFSKFIRPGYYRIDATYQPQTGVYVVAFKGPSNTVIVAVNTNTTAKGQTFTISNGLTNISLTKYVTSATKSVNAEGTVAYANSSFTDNLDAQSISTYVSSVISGVDETQMTPIRIFPNPASDYIQLSSISTVSKIQITNLTGQQMVTILSPVETKINISTYPKGAYLIGITQNGILKTFKFLKY
jgi:glucuronoarabinoxylan endo-1,4-beta-xylanase